MNRTRKILAATLVSVLVAGVAWAVTFVSWHNPATVTALDARASITTISSSDPGATVDDTTTGSAGFHLATTTAGPIAAGGQSFPLSVTNAYSGYRTGFSAGVTATGTSSMKLQSITLTQTSGPVLPAGALVVKLLGTACSKTFAPATEDFFSSRVDIVGALAPGASYGFDLAIEVVPASVQNLTTCQTFVAAS